MVEEVAFFSSARGYRDRSAGVQVLLSCYDDVDFERGNFGYCVGNAKIVVRSRESLLRMVNSKTDQLQADLWASIRGPAEAHPTGATRRVRRGATVRAYAAGNTDVLQGSRPAG
jgi:hypothetical protein